MSTNIELLENALDECYSKFQYMPEPMGFDYWQIPEELERNKLGDCEDFVIWVINKVYSKLDGGSLYMVWGTDFNGNGHCWLEYEDDTGRYWADPVINKGPLPITKWRYTPWMAAKYNGDLYSDRYVYRAKLEQKLDKNNLPFG